MSQQPQSTPQQQPVDEEETKKRLTELHRRVYHFNIPDHIKTSLSKNLHDYTNGEKSHHECILDFYKLCQEAFPQKDYSQHIQQAQMNLKSNPTPKKNEKFPQLCAPLEEKIFKKLASLPEGMKYDPALPYFIKSMVLKKIRLIGFEVHKIKFEQKEREKKILGQCEVVNDREWEINEMEKKARLEFNSLAAVERRKKQKASIFGIKEDQSQPQQGEPKSPSNRKSPTRKSPPRKSPTRRNAKKPKLEPEEKKRPAPPPTSGSAKSTTSQYDDLEESGMLSGIKKDPVKLAQKPTTPNFILFTKNDALYLLSKDPIASKINPLALLHPFSTRKKKSFN